MSDHVAQPPHAIACEAELPKILQALQGTEGSGREGASGNAFQAPFRQQIQSQTLSVAVVEQLCRELVVGLGRAGVAEDEQRPGVIVDVEIGAAPGTEKDEGRDAQSRPRGAELRPGGASERFEKRGQVAAPLGFGLAQE